MEAAAKITDLNNNDNKLRFYVANNNLTKNNEIFAFLNCYTFYKPTWSDHTKFALAVNIDSVDLKHETKSTFSKLLIKIGNRKTDVTRNCSIHC